MSRNASHKSRKPQQSTSESDAGWTTKKTRQQKKNLKKPKQPKTNLNKRRQNKRRKTNKNKLLSPTNGYATDLQSSLPTVINDIISCWPRFKSDISILQTVVNEMNLKSFDSNDHKLKAIVLDSITKIKIKKLDPIIDDITNNNQTINTNQDDDQQSIEQKESSESAPIEQKSEIVDEDKKYELSEPHDEPHD
eukprot:128631_1